MSVAMMMSLLPVVVMKMSAVLGNNVSFKGIGQI
jgi:hypothetical protein